MRPLWCQRGSHNWSDTRERNRLSINSCRVEELCARFAVTSLARCILCEVRVAIFLLLIYLMVPGECRGTKVPSSHSDWYIPFSHQQLQRSNQPHHLRGHIKIYSYAPARINKIYCLLLGHWIPAQSTIQ
jgi:hypothetical protein